MELLYSIDTVVLDKTGTITQGKPEVSSIRSFINKQEFLKIAYTLEKNSEHILAEAVNKYCKEKNVELLEITEFETIAGRGVKGKINNENYYAGNLAFLKEKKINIDESKVLNNENTVLYFANTKGIIGIISVVDKIKDTSYKAVKDLRKNKIDLIMITGDSRNVAASVATKLGINKIISEVLPQEKEAKVASLQKQGRKLAFVGDGVNDSPALARADVGIAIGAGTDIAIETADIVLVKNDLQDVVTSINLSKKVIKNIKLSLFWAFIYNIIGIPVAAGVFYESLGLTLNPMIAAACMSLSSVCVVLNALRLKRFKRR